MPIISNVTPTPKPPDIFKGGTEPASAANTNFEGCLPVFPYNNATVTPSGHSFEMDDTPERERIRLNHRSNTFLEMHPNGDEVHKIQGDGWHIVLGDQYITIGVDDGKLEKKLNIVVNGDAYVNVKGDKVEQIDGNYELHVKGNFSTVVEGINSMTSQNDTVINCGGFLGGGLKVKPGDYMSVEGDFSAKGEITAKKITSFTRVDALSGMSAGAAGFVTQLGGVSVGIPLAVPGQINCSGVAGAPGVINSTGMINALISMSSPLATFTNMNAVWATDIVNVGLHNSHFHIGNKGFPTSGPIPTEI